MARMKTLLTYFLCILGFIILSYVLENALIGNMYVKMSGNVPSNVEGIQIEDVDARATNVNGYMTFRVTNNSNNNEDKYIKIDLYNKKKNLVATKYILLEDFEKNSSKDYKIKIKGQQIRNYDISIVNELPDDSNIINIFGWKFDATNVFGFDLSKTTIFGKKLTDIFSGNDVTTKDSIKGGALGLWNWIVSFTTSIPRWAYIVGAGIVLWYMPKGFLFGIFPF